MSSALPSLVLWVSPLFLTGALSHHLTSSVPFLMLERLTTSTEYYSAPEQSSWTPSCCSCETWSAPGTGTDWMDASPFHLALGRRHCSSILFGWSQARNYSLPFHHLVVSNSTSFSFSLTKVKWKFNSYTFRGHSEVGFSHVSDSCSLMSLGQVLKGLCHCSLALWAAWSYSKE